MAVPVTDEAAEVSQRLVGALYDSMPELIPPFVCASIDGGVTLEWSRRNGDHVHFAVSPSGGAEVVVIAEGVTVEGDLVALTLFRSAARPIS